MKIVDNLVKASMIQIENFEIREAVEDDIPLILQFIKELTGYVKKRDAKA